MGSRVAARSWTVENGAVEVTLDDTPDGRLWDEDEGRRIPTVVVRMAGWAAEGLARTLEDYSAVAARLEAARGHESELAAAIRRAVTEARGAGTTSAVDNDRVRAAPGSEPGV